MYADAVAVVADDRLLCDSDGIEPPRSFREDVRVSSVSRSGAVDMKEVPSRCASQARRQRLG